LFFLPVLFVPYPTWPMTTMQESDTAKMTRLPRSAWLTLVGLALAQLLGSAGQVTLATLSGILGSVLAPEQGLATLPVTAGILGVATAALPVALLIRRYGRKPVFCAGLVWAICGAGLAAAAIDAGSFVGFCAGCFMMGNNMAVLAQYRFAAAEAVPDVFISRAVSGVMLGLLGAAVIAPWYALEFRDLLAVEFAGSFAMLPVLFVAALAIVALLPLPDRRPPVPDGTPVVSVAEVLRRREIQLAMIAAAAGYGVMSLVMTATPISMHVVDGHSVEATADVIRAHILAMFAPSLVSGWLIARVGVQRMLWVGLLLETACLSVAVTGHDVMHYRAALIALGAGWNLLYVGGTTLLAAECPGECSRRVQGINELVVFGTMAACSLSAGALLSQYGWVVTNVCGGLLTALIAFALLRNTVRPLAAG
jgi:MFS family permease